MRYFGALAGTTANAREMSQCGNLLFCDYSNLFVLLQYLRRRLQPDWYRNAVERIEVIVTLSSTEHRKYASNLRFVGCRKELFP